MDAVPLGRAEGGSNMRDLRDVKNRFEFQFDNRQLVLICAGMVLILILAFILGIIFGTSYSSSEPIGVASAAPLDAAPGEGIIEADLSESEMEAEEEAGSLPLDDEDKDREELMKKLEQEKFPAALAGDSVASSTVEAEPTDEEKPEETGTVPVEKAEEVKKPAEAPKKEAAPAPPASSSNGLYTIQLASSQNRDEAEALIKRLRTGRYDAYIVEVDLGSKGIWYRVRVGHYETREMAEKALKIIQTRENDFEDAWITK